jgi:hypothetical protein
VRIELKNLETALRDAGELRLAFAAANACEGTDEELYAYLLSNDLWGGSGSVADQAGIGTDRGHKRKAIEAALISLGNAQIKNEIVNVRTAGWVQAFEYWKCSNI